MTKLTSARIFSVFFLAFLPLLLVSSSLLSLDAKTTVASGAVALGLFAFAASWGFRCSKCHESIFMRRGRCGLLTAMAKQMLQQMRRNFRILI